MREDYEKMVSAGAHIISCIFPRWSEFKGHSPLNLFTQIFLKKIICLWCFFFLVFFYLIRIHFVLNYYRAQLRRKRKITKLRCWRIKLRSQWTSSPSPFPLLRDKVGFSGEWRGWFKRHCFFSGVGDWEVFFFFYVLSVVVVGVYVLLEDLHVSQLFPYINFDKVKYIVVGF